MLYGEQIVSLRAFKETQKRTIYKIAPFETDRFQIVQITPKNISLIVLHKAFKILPE